MTAVNKKPNVTIVGAGLSGLILAYRLYQQGIGVSVLEAASRIGGRIQTITGKQGTPLELGATWLSNQHPKLSCLLTELSLSKFEQFAEGVTLFHSKSFEPPQQFYTPALDDPSYRIASGTSMLMTALEKKLPAGTISLDRLVTSLADRGNIIELTDGDGNTYQGDIVVLCAPPRLMASSISFNPPFVPEVQSVISTVHTWMSGAIKFVIEYERPFWREQKYSGSLYSQTGLISEMYDHTDAAGTHFGFTGFLNSNAAYYSQKDREKLVIGQLASYFGYEAEQHAFYADKAWKDKFIGGEEQVFEFAHQNNGHAFLQQAYMNGKLYFSGSETADSHPGYMEGAVVAAERTASKIINQLKNI